MRNADEKMQILLVHAQTETQTEAPKSECCWSPNQDHCEKFLLNLISFRRPSLPSASFEGEGPCTNDVSREGGYQSSDHRKKGCVILVLTREKGSKILQTSYMNDPRGGTS